jgi:hypothetical protein
MFAALAGSDYTAVSMNFTFASGSPAGAQMCLTVAINDDNIIEVDETFTVILSLLSSGMEMGRTTVTIKHDEGQLY